MTAPTLQPEDLPAEYTQEELHDWPKDRYEELDGRRLAASSPVVAAHFLERMDVDDRRLVLRKLQEEEATDILSEMDADDSAEVVGSMREDRAVKILEEFDPDDAADVVAELDEEDRDRLLDRMEPESAETLKTLMAYDPDTAGGIMTPEAATILPALTVNEAIENVRAMQEELEDIYYIYVVDEAMKLLGIVSMRDLILAHPGRKIGDIMDPQIKGICHPDMDREEVALKIAEFNLLSLPVVDEGGVLLGIVTIDDVMDIVREEATEDMQKLVGAGADENIHDDISYSVRRRNPWLQVNLLTAFMAAGVVYFFQKQIEQLTILAVFMPVVASMGGNAGAQTLAVAIRSIALAQVREHDDRLICSKELLMGLLNGILTGLIAAAVVFLITSDVRIAAVVMIAMVLNMGLAGLSGAFIPLFLKKLKLDPAQSSSIFLTTVTDVAGFFIFLSLGTFLLL